MEKLFNYSKSNVIIYNSLGKQNLCKIMYSALGIHDYNIYVDIGTIKIYKNQKCIVLKIKQTTCNVTLCIEILLDMHK